MKVYLAGGMRSGWQERVIAAVPQHRYINPCDHHLTTPAEYTLWDLAGVRAADVVFAYLERDNPSGFGLSLEVGYAKALGKPVILVDEKSPADETDRRRLAMVRAAADLAFDTLIEGQRVLERLGALDGAA